LSEPRPFLLRCHSFLFLPPQVPLLTILQSLRRASAFLIYPSSPSSQLPDQARSFLFFLVGCVPPQGSFASFYALHGSSWDKKKNNPPFLGSVTPDQFPSPWFFLLPRKKAPYILHNPMNFPKSATKNKSGVALRLAFFFYGALGRQLP